MKNISTFFTLILILVLAITPVHASQMMTQNSALSSVNDPAELSNSVKEQCSRPARAPSYGKMECYADKIGYISEKQGPALAFDTLYSLQKLDNAATECHWIGHMIGMSAYTHNPEEVLNTIRHGNGLCSYGMHHGLVVAYMTRSNNPESYTQICGQKPVGNCNHAVGHVLLVLADGNVDKALDSCDAFNDSVQRQFCQQGVFMEMIVATALIAHGKAPVYYTNKYVKSLRLGGFEKRCNSYTGERSDSCWREIVHATYERYSHNPEKALDFCSRANSAKAARHCRRHTIGNSFTETFDYEKFKNICVKPQQLDPNFEEDCHQNLVVAMFESRPLEEALKLNNEFCSSLEEGKREKCFDKIRRFMENHPDGIESN